MEVIVKVLLIWNTILTSAVVWLLVNEMENDMGVIKVEHPNGYLGILYGESSMSIYDENGHECLHTGSRKVQTETELYELLEGMPNLKEMCRQIVEEGE